MLENILKNLKNLDFLFIELSNNEIGKKIEDWQIEYDKNYECKISSIEFSMTNTSK